MNSSLKLAREIATKFHQGQFYGKHPYIYHLDMVVDSVSKESDERLQVIAMLHDILEDTVCTEGILHALFEDNIVQAVVALSKLGGIPYEEYIVRVLHNPLAKIVKMHDTLCNLQESLSRRDMKRVIKYSKQMGLLAEKGIA